MEIKQRILNKINELEIAEFTIKGNGDLTNTLRLKFKFWIEALKWVLEILEV